MLKAIFSLHLLTLLPVCSQTSNCHMGTLVRMSFVFSNVAGDNKDRHVNTCRTYRKITTATKAGLCKVLFY